MNKKISFVIGGLRGGGAEQVCVTLANALVSRGYKLELVVLNLNDQVRKNELSSDVKLIDLNVQHTRSSFFKLFEYLIKSRPNTVLVFNRQLAVVLAMIRYVTKLKFLLISRNIIFLSLAESKKRGIWHGFIVKNIIKKFYALSDVFIAQSSSMERDLVKYLSLDSNKVITINNPISDKFTNMSLIDNQTEVEDYILCVGRLESQKSFHYAIESFAKIIVNYPNLKLKIIGQGSQFNQLVLLSKSLGIDNKVEFLGFKSDMVNYYKHAKLTLLTSEYEGFPNVLIESIALGTPVVSFDCCSGPSEIIENGVNGYLVRYQDKNHLVECIDKAINKRWNSNDIMKTSDKYRLDFIVDKYESILLRY